MQVIYINARVQRAMAVALGMLCSVAASAGTEQFSATASGYSRGYNLTAAVTPDKDDIGQVNLYAVGCGKDGACYAKQGGTNGGWVRWAAGTPLPVHSTVIVAGAVQMPVLTGDDITQVLGMDVYVGYGRNESDMLNNRKYSKVQTIRAVRNSTGTAKNVIFFLGDGMGIPVMTAARIYAVGEDGSLTMDTLPESAFVRTFSNDSQVTDSAPSMSAYMTGVKMNNEVLSMTPDTQYQKSNGYPVTTFLELAKSIGWSTGVVTTTRVTHATPAATYAHISDRDLENDIAAQLVPNGTAFNSRLLDGVDVLFGGGCAYFFKTTETCGGKPGKRTDNRNLVNEMKTLGYAYADSKTTFDAIVPAAANKAIGLFTSSHMSYELDRDPAKEPSLAEMTAKAMDILSKNGKGYFLMVEGGRIDHALHETNAARALKDTVAFDDAIKSALDKARLTDPNLQNTLIVVTADHDHTMVLNGYAKRTGPTTAANPGILGLARNYVTGSNLLDADKMPYTILGFGNGENRVQGSRSSATALTDAVVSDKNYHQEAAIRTAAGSETHGGTDVFLGAIGAGAQAFHGFMDNTNVFSLLRDASGL